MSQIDNIGTLAEMFPNVDIETIKLIYLECGSFERAMENLLQGDRSTTWKSARPRQQQQYPQHQDNFRPNYSNVSYQQNSSVYTQPHQNYYYQQQQTFVPQFAPRPANFQPQKLVFPSDLTNIKTNPSLFGSSEAGVLFNIPNSESDISLSSRSPFSRMPMNLSTTKTKKPEKYPNWNFSEISAPRMRISKSVDTLRQLDD